MAAGNAPNPIIGIVRLGRVIRKAFCGAAGGMIDASADKAGILDRIGMGAVLAFALQLEREPAHRLPLIRSSINLVKPV